MYGEGISKLGEIIDLGVKAGIIEKAGSWFSYGSQRIGQGRDNVREFLKNNPDIAGNIEKAVRKSSQKIEEELLVGGPDGQMIANVIASQFGATLNWPLGSALSIVMLVVVLVVLSLSQRLDRSGKVELA